MDNAIHSILVVSIMIKNEAGSICNTLQPFVNSNVRNFLIYDTGSEDDTVNVVKNYCKSNKLNYHIIEEPFVSFCFSRNKCIELTKKHFPNHHFFLMIDCEWYASGISHLIEYCCMNLASQADFFHMDLKNGDMVFKHSRLMRIKGNAKFVGRVHEYVVGSNGGTVGPNFFIEWKPTDAGAKKSAARFKRDLILLFEDYNETHDPRAVFYLAQTYESLSDTENAIKYYKERSEMTNGFVEEQYMALYRIGNIYNNLHAKEEDTIKKTFYFEEATRYYLKAYKCRNTRAEPLVQLACMNFDGKIKYMYAHAACRLSYPNDLLFVQKDLYDWTRWDQLGIGAYWAGEFEEQLKALKICLDINMHMPHLRNNLKCCLESLGKPLKPKILNLILYSPGYENMYNVLSNYLKKLNIDHYFYMYSNEYEENFTIIDDIIYIKGEESFLPGITNKTLDVFEFASNSFKYDYIIRSNVSSVINYELLQFWLSYNDVDYAGPYNYTGSFVDIKSGITEEKHKLYGKIPFIGGCCIVLSNKAIQTLVDNKEKIKKLNIIDDVAIGIGLYKYCKDLVRGNLTFKHISCNNSTFNPNVIFYRNNTENNRERDVEMMKIEVKHFLPKEITLEEKFLNACSIKSDINEHVPIFYKYALECDSVVEIGVRSIVSSWGFLHGLKKGSKYIGIDLNNPGELHLMKELAEKNEINFKFIAKNDMLIDPEEIGKTDILFIDSLHTYAHLTYELEKFHHLSEKYLMFHDSSPPWENVDDTEYHGNFSEYPESIDKTKRGIWPAISDFLERHGDIWKLKQRLTNNHGLVILEKIRENDLTTLD